MNYFYHFKQFFNRIKFPDHTKNILIYKVRRESFHLIK